MYGVGVEWMLGKHVHVVRFGGARTLRMYEALVVFARPTASYRLSVGRGGPQSLCLYARGFAGGRLRGIRGEVLMRERLECGAPCDSPTAVLAMLHPSHPIQPYATRLLACSTASLPRALQASQRSRTSSRPLSRARFPNAAPDSPPRPRLGLGTFDYRACGTAYRTLCLANRTVKRRTHKTLQSQASAQPSKVAPSGPKAPLSPFCSCTLA
jgi:hypothetical protein